MAVDYDLVIVGETLEAREAAAIAARQGARVALVLSLAQLASRQEQALMGLVLSHWGQPALPWAAADTAQSWPQLRYAMTLAGAIAEPQLEPAALAAQGVDVVIDAGYFSPKPQLAFTTEQRRLTARAYLLACGSERVVPAIPGLAQTPYLTPESLLALEQLPSRLVVLGRGAAAVALAQTLAALGSDITLISRGSQLLPDEDADVAQFVAALLSGSGVRLKLQAQIEQVQQTPVGQVVLQLEANGPIEADQLLLVTGAQPAIAGLNLERVGVQQRNFRLVVDDRLRTHNRRIFAAGAVRGGELAGALARHDMQVALHNALYLPGHTVSPGAVPYRIGTTPALGRVGMSEAQARQRYGADIRVLRQSFSASLEAHLLQEPTGFCKLVAHRNGTLLGAALVGPQASDLVQTLALLVGQPDAMVKLASFPAIPQTLTDLLVKAAQLWQQQRWQPGRWRRDWAENWFNWRRSR